MQSWHRDQPSLSLSLTLVVASITYPDLIPKSNKRFKRLFCRQYIKVQYIFDNQCKSRNAFRPDTHLPATEQTDPDERQAGDGLDT